MKSGIAEGKIKGLDSGKCVAIEITNQSSITLTSARYYCDSGKVCVEPSPSVASGAQDYSVFTKTDYSVFGSVGIVTYQLGTNQSSRLAIMFSNPFWRVFHDYTFALHITQSEASTVELYQGLHNHRALLENCIKAAGDLVKKPLTLVRDGVRVTGVMSARDKSVLKVVIEDSPGSK